MLLSDAVITTHQKSYQIALEDNLIQFSAKNSEIHKLRINTNKLGQSDVLFINQSTYCYCLLDPNDSV